MIFRDNPRDLYAEDIREYLRGLNDIFEQISDEESCSNRGSQQERIDQSVEHSIPRLPIRNSRILEESKEGMGTTRNRLNINNLMESSELVPEESNEIELVHNPRRNEAPSGYQDIMVHQNDSSSNNQAQNAPDSFEV